MAVNLTVYDLDNYPDNNKTMTVDQTTVVPVGYEGDEQWVLSFTTAAYSNNTSLTAIQDIYVQEMNTGWYKSSGLVDLSNVTISGGGKVLGLNIDNSSGWYYIELTESTYGPDALAKHIRTLIRDVPNTYLWSSSDDSLAYMNALVEYEDGKIKIISGTVAANYSGTAYTSVAVTYSGSDALFYDLGFDLGIGSYDIATTSIKERLVTANCGSTSTSISINTMTGLVSGDPIGITDGTNTDYVIAQAGTTPSNIVIISGSLTNSYSASRAKIQKMALQDPEQVPASYHSTADSITRWGIMSITNQIDFTS